MIKTLILIVIVLAAAKYFFNWSVFDAFGSAQGQATVLYLGQVFVWAKAGVLALLSHIH